MEDKDFGARLKAVRLVAKKTVAEVSAYLTSLGRKASEKTIYEQLKKKDANPRSLGFLVMPPTPIREPSFYPSRVSSAIVYTKQRCLSM